MFLSTCPSWILYPYSKGKGKVHSRTGHEGLEGKLMYSSTLPSTSALHGEDGWSTPRHGRFTPGKDPVLIVQEAVWAPGPVWAGAENLVPTGIRSPDCPARSKSLYRLRYPGPYPHSITSILTMKSLLSSILHMLVVITLTLRRLMSYIYGAPILDVSRSHTTTQHSR